MSDSAHFALNLEPHFPTTGGTPSPPTSRAPSDAAARAGTAASPSEDSQQNVANDAASHASPVPQAMVPTVPNTPADGRPVHARIGYEILAQGALAWAAQKGADTSRLSASKGKAKTAGAPLTQEALAAHNMRTTGGGLENPARTLDFDFDFTIDRAARANANAATGDLLSPFRTPPRRSESRSTNLSQPNPAFSSPAMAEDAAASPSTGRKRKATDPLEDGQIGEPGTPTAKRLQMPGGLRTFSTQATYASSGPRTPTPGWSRASHTSRRTPRPPTPGPSTRTYHSASQRRAGDHNRYAALAEDDVLPSLPGVPTAPSTPTPASTGALDPPALVIDTVVEFLLPFTKLQRTLILDAYKQKAIQGPDVSKMGTDDFWPEALQLAADNAHSHLPDGQGGAAGTLAEDYAMVTVQELPDLVDIEDGDDDDDDDSDIDVMYPYDPTGEPEDTQNLIVTPSAVPNGGRLTNRPHPLPRPHLHFAANIQPPVTAEHTEEPDNGFPKVRRDDPEGLYAGGERDKICSISLANPKRTVVVEPLCYGGIRQGEGWKITKEVLGLLKELFGVKNLVVIPAETRDPPPRFDTNDIHTRIPRFLGVKGLPRWVARALIMQQLWATRTFAANFFSPQLRFDDYLGRLEGFVHDVEDAVERLMKAKFEEDAVRNIIRKYVIANPHCNHDEPEDAVQKIINTLRIRIEKIEPDGKPVTHIYLDTPTHTVETFRAFRKEMRGLRFMCGDNGTGVWITEQPCAVCNSADHVATDCPLPRLTNWAGPAFTFRPG